MFRFLIAFGLAAIVLMLIVAFVRGRRSGGQSGRGYLGHGGGGGGAAAAGLSTDWGDRPTDFSHDGDPGEMRDGGNDGGGGSDGASGGGGGGGGDGGGGGRD